MAAASLSTASLRELIFQVLRGDAALDSFLLDYFPDVKRDTTAGMLRTAKIDLLMERHGVDLVFETLRSAFPEKVARHGAHAPLPVAASQLPSSFPIPDRQALYRALCTMIPGAFDSILFQLGVELQYLSSAEAPQTTRAAEVIRMFDGQGEAGYRKIAAIILKVAPHALPDSLLRG